MKILSAIVAAASAVLLLPSAPAQISTGGPGYPLGAPAAAPFVATSLLDREAAQRRIKQHQERIIADAARLLTLAQQLQHAAAGTSRARSIQTAADIEKLARGLARRATE